MRKELESQLVKNYPKIFRDRFGDPKETLMCWGFECGDGWYDILDVLCNNIQHHINWRRKTRAFDLLRYRAAKRGRDALLFYMTKGREPSEWELDRIDEIYEQGVENMKIAPKVDQVVAVQVKEKFGGLRFYVSGGDEYIDGMITLAESLSMRTCEECGSPGKRRGRGWIYTACDAHTREEDLTDVEEENEDRSLF